MITSQHLLALAPLIVLAASALAVLAGIATRRRHDLALGTAVVGLVLTLASIWWSAAGPRPVGPLLTMDRYALLYTALAVAIALLTALLSHSRLERGREQPEEFYLLLLTATIGAAILAAGNHLVSIFLGLETLSISLFALIGYPRSDRRAVEAALKYLVLSGASSALLLFGVALAYAALGTMSIREMAWLLARWPGTGLFVPTSLALIAAGLGFKLALVPFHLWAPDVYQGAPAPITALLATASKAAVFAALIRLFFQLGVHRLPSMVTIFSLLAVLSMLVGNLLALYERNLKRLLAYSSIAHLGYLLVAFLAGGSFGVEAATYYLIAYSVTMLAALGVVTVLSELRPPETFEAELLEDYRGLFWRQPGLAALLTAALLSLAGIPLTGGYIGKFLVLASGVGTAHWALLLVLVGASGISLVYYLRVVVMMLSPVLGTEAPPRSALPPGTGLVLGFLGLLLLWLGVLPAGWQRLIRLTVTALP